MMLLKIDAFRKLQNKTYELPETGLVRILGDSGAGKSTFFDAISFVLYGQERNTSLFGEKKTKVSLQFVNHEMSRQKYPEKLSFGDSIGQDAQSHINRLLGMDCTQFAAAGYVRQDMATGILRMTPGEQLRLLQEVAFGNQNPEELSEKVKNYGQKHSQELAINEELSKNFKSQIESNNAKILELHVKINDLPDYSDTTGHESDIFFDELLSKIDSHQNKINELNRELNHPDRTIDVDIARVDKSLADIIGHESDIKLHEVWVKAPKEKISRAISELNSKIPVTVNQERINSGLLQHGQALASLQQVDEKEISELRQTVSSALHAIEQSKHDLKCPQCNSIVKLYQKKLVLSTAATFPLIEGLLLNPKIEKLEHQEKLLKEKIRLTDLVASLGTHVDIEIDSDTLRTKLSKLQAYYNEQMSLDKINNNNKELTLRLQANKDALLKQMTLLLQKRSILNLRSQTVIASEIAAEDVLLTQSKSDIENAKKLQQQRQLAIQTAITRKNYNEQIHEIDDKNYQLSGMLRDSDAAIEQHISKIQAAVRIKTLMDISSVSSVSSVLDSINNHAAEWIQTFFPNGGTECTLLNIKNNKSGTQKAQMSVIVSHNGYECGLSDMSGGEQSRLVLAFQLALASMYRSPLLLLDEPFKGLDRDVQDACLEALSAYAKDKLVIVADHVTQTSIYDAVISV